MKIIRLLSAPALFLFLFVSVLKAQPYIDSVTSAYSTAGSLVKIKGSGFAADPSQNIVKFGSVRAEVVAANSTQLMVVAPPAGQDAFISVINTNTGLRGISKHQFSNRYCVASVPNFNYTSIHTTSPIPGLRNPSATDMDGDGLTDLVVGNTQANNMKIYLGQAGTNPTLSTPVSILANRVVNQPNTIVTADLDNDGLEDVITSPDLSGNVLYLFRNHSVPGNLVINYQASVPIPGAPGPLSVADFDRDGRLDIAVATANGSIYVMRNLGGFLFGSPVILASGGTINMMLAADIDNDRRMDLLPSGTSGNAFLNISTPGNISFTGYPLSFLASTTELDAVDMDLNGVIDLLVLTSASNLVVYRCTGSPGLPSFAAPSTVHYGTSIGAGDLTGDGKAEPFYTMTAGWICTNENLSTPGNCQWGGQRDHTATGQGSRFFRGDFNGDGLEDFGNLYTAGNVNIISAGANGISSLTLTTGPACGAANGSATVTQIQSSVSTAGAVYAWSNGASGPSVNTLSPGLNTVTVSLGQCTYSADFLIEGGNEVSAQVNVTQPVCSYDPGVVVVIPSGANTYQYAWSNGATNAQVSLPVGNYTVTVSSEVGCQVVQPVVITALETVDAQLAIQQPACVGEPGTASVVSVSGGSNHTYLWSNGEQTVNATLVPGFHSVTVTSANGCAETETFSIYPGTAQPLDAGADQTVCEGETVTLVGAGDATAYFWSNGVTNGVAFQPTQTAYYVLSGQAAACPGYDTVWVYVNPVPATQFTSASNLLSVQFNDLTPGMVSRAWDFGDGSTSTLANPSHTYASPGAYQVCLTATHSFGCSRTVCETISVTATGISSPVDFQFSVAPNPVRDLLLVSIDRPAGSVLTLRVMDATGKVVASTSFTGNATELNVASLAAGVYMLELVDGDLAVRTRFVKQD